MPASDTPSERQQRLLQALLDPAAYSHPAVGVAHLETHISHILLAGDYAYKIKKPLNLGFLDFTTLARREAACRDELRLNHRTAPELYLDCPPITGKPDSPRFGGSGPVLEWAVRMRRFDQDALLDRRLTAGRVTAAELDVLATLLAGFHAAATKAGANSRFGAPEAVLAPALDNFAELDRRLEAPADRNLAVDLESWTRATFERLAPVFRARKAGGWVRECHGDLHLGNIVLSNDRPVPFDCIEFNEDLRWIDVMADLGFLLMDLRHRQAPSAARRLLNVYLEHGGDYAGLEVLPFYQVYRAIVRAKIAAIRLAQGDLPTEKRDATRDEVRAYLELAKAFTRPPQPFMLITHGLSGSGKSWHSGQLLESLDAVRLRSDVERKRLHGLPSLADSGSAPDEGLYTPQSTAHTYGRLAELADTVLGADWPVLVDATFLEARQRTLFRHLAERRGLPFVLLACRADPDTLRQRVRERRDRGNDAAEADGTILERQLQGYRPPDESEHPLWADDDPQKVMAALLARLRG